MTPAVYARGGAGQAVNYAIVASPLGRLLVAATARGICSVQLGGRGEGRGRGLGGELEGSPGGRPRSYREIAARIGQPRAARAVARACASNPVAILVPCHRVVHQDGSLPWYPSGVDRKP